MRSHRRSLKAHGLPMLLFWVLSAAVRADSIHETEAVFLPGGKGIVRLHMGTAIEGVAGIQGVCYFDSSRITMGNVTLGPNQPASFSLRVHSVEPGEIRFIAYSVANTFLPAEPLLTFHLGLKYPEHEHTLASMVVVTLPFVALADGSLRVPEKQFINIPITAEMKDPEGSFWLMN
ncbi:MAG: hypothetical protein PHG55_04515 [Verrucomicrobiota bacterium]|nr:hypothetical protein [Verrucomicrobiota bacterium]